MQRATFVQIFFSRLNTEGLLKIEHFQKMQNLKNAHELFRHTPHSALSPWRTFPREMASSGELSLREPLAFICLRVISLLGSFIVVITRLYLKLTTRRS